MADAVLNARIDSNTGEVAKGMEEVAKNTENVGKAAQKSSGGVKKLGVSFGTLMKATGIVALLSKAFEVLKEVFMSNQKVVDGFNVVMESLKRVFNDLFKVITDNVEPIKAAFKALFEDPKQAISDFSDTRKCTNTSNTHLSNFISCSSQQPGYSSAISSKSLWKISRTSTSFISDTIRTNS